jgi:hypothetical protein
MERFINKQRIQIVKTYYQNYESGTETARSSDLTPCDFFMWDYVKSKVYVNNPRTIQQLKAEILCVIVDITPDICERVIINFIERVNTCRLSGGGHMPDIVFHH